MKAISYNDKNDIFEYIEKEVPKLDKNLDVLVKVIAVGLNPVDAKLINGLL